jgi:hypothetical protein
VQRAVLIRALRPRERPLAELRAVVRVVEEEALLLFSDRDHGLYILRYVGD